jgi:hypothetical protein
MSRLGECFSDVDFKTPVTRRKVIPYYPGDGAILAANEQSQTYRVGQDRVLENDSRGRLPRSSSDRMGWVALAYVWGTLSERVIYVEGRGFVPVRRGPWTPRSTTATARR